jgi:4-aminobutyrate aminotransferase-like enzyme
VFLKTHRVFNDGRHHIYYSLCNVRGVGALMGVELVKQDGEPYGSLAAAVMRQGLQDGLILVGGGQNGNVLSFAPPFAISDVEIEFLAAKLEDYLVFLPGSIS